MKAAIKMQYIEKFLHEITFVECVMGDMFYNSLP